MGAYTPSKSAQKIRCDGAWTQAHGDGGCGAVNAPSEQSSTAEAPDPGPDNNDVSLLHGLLGGGVVDVPVYGLHEGVPCRCNITSPSGTTCNWLD